MIRSTGKDRAGELNQTGGVAASLDDAARALGEGRLDAAYRLLRSLLADDPHDPPALRLLAGVAVASGRPDQAEHMLRHALALAPSDTAARDALAGVLARLGRAEDALGQVDLLLAEQSEERALLTRKASLLNALGRFDETIPLYEALLARHSDDAWLWIAYGHDLRAVGRIDDCIAAYRRAAGLTIEAGAAWWSLANLKTARFDANEIARMEAAAARPAGDAADRVFTHFALGKAWEDRGEWAPSFDHYQAGNRLHRATFDYEAAAVSAFVDRSLALFSADFFAARGGWGRDEAGPIFILGMPRSGSTLVEQILSAHSAVEGTGELPIMPELAAQLGAAPLGLSQTRYPDEVGRLDRAAAAALGEAYLARSQAYRRTQRRHFVDKLPTNWAHAGLIHLLLPNARIIDVRRDPLDCCLSNYKQHYAFEQRFAYDLAELGAYYRDYARLTDHLAALLPARVHRIRYERLIDDNEGETRRLLDFLGLSFEPACLRPHENARAVRTPSAQQVRRPINRDGMERWRPYAPWLGPLQAALGG